MEIFNIFSQVQDELKDFFQTKIKIGSAIVDGIEKGGYEYSQWELLQTIEYMDGSKFLSGDKDSEGQQKFYLNSSVFRREVASKNIDLDVKNFNFIPEEGQSQYGAIIARKKFKKWAKDEGLSEMINDTVDRFPKYGTLVMKECGKDIEVVPLGKLRNQQDATSLEDATYVIIEHNGMTKHELDEKPDWDTSGLELKWNDKVTIYERYGYVPKSLLKSEKGEVRVDDDEPVYAVAIIALDKGKQTKGGTLLFIEETECPFIEIHYSRQDGRWMGVGEMEKQIENQAIRNMVFNLRKKSLAWSSKNIFGSLDDTLAQNLVRDVKDGDILKLSTVNGMFRIDTTNKSSADYNSVDQLVEENSNQRAFTFEVATGEQMNSGTPFRLGAILSNSVNSYYDKKREQLGIFWKNVIMEFMLDRWIKETEEEFVEGVFDTEEGFDDLREAKKDLVKAQIVIQAILAGKASEVSPEAINLLVDATAAKTSKDFYKMTREEIKSLKYRFDLDITGESVDMLKKMETLSTVYQTQLQSGQIDAANETLKKIMVMAGERMPKAIMQPNMSATGMGGTPSAIPMNEVATA